MEFVESLKYSFGALKEGRLYAHYVALMVTVSLLYFLAHFAPSLYFLSIVPFALALWYFIGKFMHFKLVQEKLASGGYTLELYSRFASALIMQLLHVFLFWRAKKWLALYILPLAGALLILNSLSYAGALKLSSQSGALDFGAALGSTLSGFIVLLVGILLLFLAYVYHSYRLCFMAQIGLLNPQLDLGLCSQKSWQVTEGKVLRLLSYVLGFTVCAGIPITALAVIIAALFALPIGFQLSMPLSNGAVGSLFYAMNSFLLVYLYKSIACGAKAAKAPASKRMKKAKKKRK